MANSYGPKGIVTDGLVFCIDAGNTHSYISGSSTATDLIYNAECTLENDVVPEPNSWDFDFDGTDTWITIPNSDVINLKTKYTLMAWINPTSVAGWDAIIYKNGNESYHFGIDPDGYIQGGVYDSNWKTFRSNTNILTTGTWQHAALTWDNASTTIIAYKNSIVAGSNTSFGPFTLSGNSDDAYIGKQHGTTNYYNGKLNLPLIYNRALTASEILQNYNSQKSRFGL